MIEPIVFLTPKPSTGPCTWHCCLSQYVGWVKQPFHKTGKRESLALTVYMFKNKTSKRTSQCGKAGGSAVQGSRQACCSPLNVLVLPQGGRLSLGHAFNEIHQLFHEKPEFKQKKKGWTLLRKSENTELLTLWETACLLSASQPSFSLLHINLGTTLHNAEQKPSHLTEFPC